MSKNTEMHGDSVRTIHHKCLIPEYLTGLKNVCILVSLVPVALLLLNEAISSALTSHH
jgi:hypothetical protein